jgi:phenylpropionate dioxygenase-like ring-hydroxylating dioxygenase large terminal subunit
MTEPFLRNIWYFALPSTALKRGRMTAHKLLGEKLLFGRAGDGTVFALRDVCPHRGIPLSYGRFDGAEIECCYHGWRFDTDGRCTAIPSLVEGQRLDLAKIRVPHLPCREAQGCVWVYWGDGEAPAADIVRLPDVPDGRAAGIAETMIFPCAVDHAVVGLMDPAHGPFVHRSWWWRTRRSIHEKAKAFAPSPLGFQMVRHRPSSNSRAYRLLGGAPETEITFRLPGVRVEHIRAGRHVVTGLTAVTPIDAATTQVAHLIWWTTPWLTPLRPVARLFARAFLKQDRDVVVMQQEGLRHDPPLMLINDADMQAKWYYQLKAEYAKAQEEGRPFANPVTERVLRWRS